VLILHDPTTAVDSVTEARIAVGIRDVRQGLTTLVITTSPALLAATGRVILIEDGRVTAMDGHSELVDARDDYRELVLA
jgi:putative ABC transport system ATP-binding protein